MSKNLRTIVDELKILLRPNPFPAEAGQAALKEIDRLTGPPPPEKTDVYIVKKNETHEVYIKRSQIKKEEII
jgi:hypothetical protein